MNVTSLIRRSFFTPNRSYVTGSIYLGLVIAAPIYLAVIIVAFANLYDGQSLQGVQSSDFFTFGILRTVVLAPVLETVIIAIISFFCALLGARNPKYFYFVVALFSGVAHRQYGFKVVLPIVAFLIFAIEYKILKDGWGWTKAIKGVSLTHAINNTFAYFAIKILITA